VSGPAVGLTQPPVRWVPGVLSPGLKSGRGVTLTTHPHLVPRSRMSRSCTSSPSCACIYVLWDCFSYVIINDRSVFYTELIFISYFSIITSEGKQACETNGVYFSIQFRNSTLWFGQRCQSQRGSVLEYDFKAFFLVEIVFLPIFAHLLRTFSFRCEGQIKRDVRAPLLRFIDS
jgi:hypothetical protein